VIHRVKTGTAGRTLCGRSVRFPLTCAEFVAVVTCATCRAVIKRRRIDVVDAEHKSSYHLARARDLDERGKAEAAERERARSERWLERANELRGLR
jgi:hypothetical protein